MGKKSDRRIFRKRRQRAGFALLASLAVVVVGAIMFSSLQPLSTVSNLSAQGGETGPVQRVDAPAVEGAPEAAKAEAPTEARNVGGPTDEELAAQEEEAAEQKRAAEEEKAQAESDGAGEQEKAQEEQASGPPPIPKPATNDLWMDIPALGLNDNYIANDDSVAAMDAGAIKLPSSAFPWENDANTYIAAHRLGWPGTASDHQFYNLPNLALGDKIYLYDENLTVYTYEVTGFKEVLPSENYVTAPQAGRDMISLQTCIEDYGDYWTMGPNWYVRYVVQADRVSVDPA
ncbi:MAG: Sortase A, LPXTG specific [uncultured Rubrobacteraceae bacterium]|uniref:Sortase A, LPXTG specific n=1 Tax=uncultured Rubrobacteraceae bacterium TaxID=349277 RepID=A0A6J4SMZ6_9ACTN|nr:MAG: Sortase A, LPXTG specific [uncultured Rubrobacteraceae bacterium]